MATATPAMTPATFQFSDTYYHNYCR